MKRIGIIILVLLTANVLAMSQNNTKVSKNEERLTEQLHFLDKLLKNGARRITEYDSSNDQGSDIALWSNEKSISEAKDILTKILSERKNLRGEKSSYSLTYQARVRRWGFNLEEKDNQYDNVLRVLTRFNEQYKNNFDDLVLKEVDTALGLKYYSSALYLLDNYINLQEREEKLRLLNSYLPKFKGTKEEVQIEIRILEEDHFYRLQQLESEITFESAKPSLEKKWVSLATELSKKVENLRSKSSDKALQRRLNNLLINQKTQVEATQLNANSGDLTLKIFACVRSEKVTLKRTTYGPQYKVEGEKELKSFEGIQILRTEVKDNIPEVKRYKFALWNPASKAEESNTYIDNNKIALSIQGHDDSSKSLMAVDIDLGEPVSGVVVNKLDMRNGKVLETYRTDKKGMVILPHSKSSEGYNIKIDDSRLLDPVYFYIPGTSSPTYINKKALNYYPDRPIYRRGQEVRVGLLLTESKEGVINELPSEKLNLKFIAYRGSKEIEIDKLSTTTNNHGIAEIKLVIPEDQDLSNYTIKSEYGDYDLSVEDYKLQYLNVKFNRIPKGYVANQPLVVEGETTDLNGRPTAANIILTYEDNKRVETQSGVDGKFTITTPPVTQEDSSIGYRYYGWGYHSLALSASDALGNVATDELNFNKLNTDLPLDANALGLGDKTLKEKFTLNTASQPYTKRLLGDLSDRIVKAEILNNESTERIDLGSLPIEGKKDFSLPNLKSGGYRIKLYAKDGYGKEVSSTSEPIYIYSESDRKLYSDDLLWATKTSDGGILYGSSQSTTLTLIKYQGEKALEYRFIPLSKGVLYKLPPKEIKGLDRIVLRICSPLSNKEEHISLTKGETSGSEIELIGLDFKEDESLLPGAHFKRTIKLTREGKALKQSPVIVTVFDKGVADAAGDNYFWQKVENSRDYLRGMDTPYYYQESRVMATAKSFGAEDMMLKEAAVVEDRAGDMSNIQMRSNFVETAFFSAQLVTDNNGEVVLEFDLPDTETKYNIKVYSFEKEFKHQLLADYYFKVYSPLSIDLSMPRFLTWDDTLFGEALLRNSSDQALESRYQIVLKSGEVLAEGNTLVPAKGTKAISFSMQATQEMGEEVVLQARVLSGEISDGIERRLPLISNLSTYVVATPISLYQQDRVTLNPQKVEISTSDALLELYLDPIMVILSHLAFDYRENGVEPQSLFPTIYRFNIYKRLELYLSKNPNFKSLLKSRAAQLSKLPMAEQSGIEDRLSDPQTLAKFFSFITNEQELAQALLNMEGFILSHKVNEGGFRYDGYWHHPSPFLTSYILNKLAPVSKQIANKELTKHLQSSISFLQKELERKDSFYKDYIDYALIAHYYGVSLENLSANARIKYKKQVQDGRESYQKTYTSEMLRFAEHSRIYDTPQQKAEVRKFIEDRCEYSWSDDELAAMKIFLTKNQKVVDKQLVEFLLKMKQATLWHSSGIMDVTEVILDKIAPSTISEGAEVVVNGQGYKLNAEEIARGYVKLRYPNLTDEMTITWMGIDSDYIFGGIRYLVTEPSKHATPTGEKLKVRKQIFVRQVSSNGEQKFEEVTETQPARKGDKLIIRYTIDAQQDLSLVVLVDPRPAGAEFGYDFNGFRFGDKLWWTYSRRDQEDRIYMDYIPRGQHTIELEATASNSGTYTYGPAKIQSYYAPEFAGNSAGGSIQVERKE